MGSKVVSVLIDSVCSVTYSIIICPSALGQLAVHLRLSLNLREYKSAPHSINYNHQETLGEG
jgi:hypothetical protein